MVQAWCKGGRRSILWSNSVQILPPPVGKTFILNFVQLFRISTLSRFSHGCQVFLLKLWQRGAGCYNQPIKSKVINAIKIHFNDILYCDTPWLQIYELFESEDLSQMGEIGNQGSLHLQFLWNIGTTAVLLVQCPVFLDIVFLVLFWNPGYRRLILPSVPLTHSDHHVYPRTFTRAHLTSEATWHQNPHSFYNSLFAHIWHLTRMAKVEKYPLPSVFTDCALFYF